MSLLGPVLIVEDNDRDYEIIANALQNCGYPIDCYRADCGEDCLDRLQHGRPSFILLDLNLPGLDGRDVLSEVKSDVDLRSIPITVLTTSDNPRDVSFCYQHGVNSYHLKPIHLKEFRSTLQSIADYWFNRVVLPDSIGAAR